MTLPPRRSLGRMMSERARAGEPPAAQGAEALGDLLGGLGRMLQGLQEAVEKAAATPEGERKFVVGYQVKVGPLGAAAEPFGHVAPAPDAAPAARQPIVDVFEEADAILVVAELPGAAEEQVTARVEDGALLIESPPPHAYRKRVALPAAVDAARLSLACRNGILEVRLPRAGEAA